MRFPGHAALAALAILAQSCLGPSRCPAGRICGVSTWIVPAGGAAVEGQFIAAPATDSATAEGSLGSSEQLPLRATPTLLRFDLAALGAARSVEQAMLSLTPHPSWSPTGQPVRIVVRAVLTHWSARAVGAEGFPLLGDAPAAQAILPGRVRMPIRLDVTDAVRAWFAGAVPPEGLALSVEGPDVVFTGTGALAGADRPRLEVVAR